MIIMANVKQQLTHSEQLMALCPTFNKSSIRMTNIFKIICMTYSSPTSKCNKAVVQWIARRALIFLASLAHEAHRIEEIHRHKHKWSTLTKSNNHLYTGQIMKSPKEAVKLRDRFTLGAGPWSLEWHLHWELKEFFFKKK